MDGPQIHIHEDDWGMRNLYPLAARAEAAGDVGAAREAGERNRAPGGVGWTDVHVIQPPSISFADAGLTVAAFEGALTPLLPRVRRFVATAWSGFTPGNVDPWGSYDDAPLCFGFNARGFIKAEADGPLVKTVWFQLGGEPAQQAVLRQALLAIDALTPSLIADYSLDVEGAVGDPAFLARYVEAVCGEGD